MQMATIFLASLRRLVVTLFAFALAMGTLGVTGDATSGRAMAVTVDGGSASSHR